MELERARDNGSCVQKERLKQLETTKAVKAGERRVRKGERESVNVFLTTEEGAISKETGVREPITEKTHEGMQVFSVPLKRSVASEIEEGEESTVRGKVRPIIAGLSPEEWTVLVYPKGRDPERLVHPVDPAMEKEAAREGEWAHHPCCGTLCAVCNVFLRPPTEEEKSARIYF